jgi:type I restriction enzyme S subunit
MRRPCDSGIDGRDMKYAPLDTKERNSLGLKAGDILMIRSNGSVSLVGKTALVSEKETGYAFAGYLMRLRVDERRAIPAYVHLALESHDVREQVEMPVRSTNGVHNINSSEVRQLEINLPSLVEQQEIVRRAEKLFKLADEIEKQVGAATKRVEKLTQAILAKAFRGELVPTEAELARKEGRSYEPASVLLESIRKERASLLPSVRRKR